MSTLTTKPAKRFSLGISLKLFFAFWLVIITSVLISYLITIQFSHSPSQEQAEPEQLALLNLYNQQIANKQQLKLSALQSEFYHEHQQYLLIKKISNNKVYTPRRRGWSEVREYLKKHSLDNPVTIDFAFVKVTSSGPIIVNDELFQLFIASNINHKRLVSWVSQLPMAIRVFLLFAISFLCCWWLAKSFTKPLIAIQKASKDIGEGKLSTRITSFEQRSDEFGALARSFNKMAEQLEGNITAHQRLLADVSHELRSPLTRLQLAVALAEKNIGNASEQQKHLNRCETEVERLDEMIADVLTLSRLEHNQNAFTIDDIDLNTLVAQVVNDCQYFATSKQVVITLMAKANCPLVGNSKLLISAISNVINNAVKYSPVNDLVSVNLTKQNDKILLSVADKGPGVPADMLTKLFSPFFRVADGRERSSGGTGLGLAIAQQAILLHQGSIIAHNMQPNGLQVTITLPLQMTR